MLRSGKPSFFSEQSVEIDSNTTLRIHTTHMFNDLCKSTTLFHSAKGYRLHAQSLREQTKFAQSESLWFLSAFNWWYRLMHLIGSWVKNKWKNRHQYDLITIRVQPAMKKWSEPGMVERSEAKYCQSEVMCKWKRSAVSYNDAKWSWSGGNWSESEAKRSEVKLKRR